MGRPHLLPYVSLASCDPTQRRDAAFDEPQIAWIVTGVLHALEYMHTQRKAIHRDIKAANILVSADAQVLTMDLPWTDCLLTTHQVKLALFTSYFLATR